MKIILASQSPRRKELMDLLKIKYEIMPSMVDETLEEGLSIIEQSKRLAYIKAKEIFNKTSEDRIIIGSDSMIIKDGKIYGKPKDEQDAIQILNELKNSSHQVITSLCVMIQDNGQFKQYLDYDIAEVYFKDMTGEEIRKWVKTGKPLDKAGGYAIQSEFCVYVDKIEGNYTTVVGLPIHKLYEVLKKHIPEISSTKSVDNGK